MLGDEQGLDFDPADVSREKEEAYIPPMPEAKLIEPIAAIAREAQGRLPMAVAVRRPGDQAATGIGRHSGLVGAVVTADDENYKPAPDTFLKAAR